MPLFCHVSRRERVYCFESNAGRRGAGQAPSPSTLRRRLTALSRQAGVTDPIHPHVFRSFLVNASMARGDSLQSVSRLLGHILGDHPSICRVNCDHPGSSRVETTSRYYWTDDATAQRCVLRWFNAPPSPTG